MRFSAILLFLLCRSDPLNGFALQQPARAAIAPKRHAKQSQSACLHSNLSPRTCTRMNKQLQLLASLDVDTIGLVVGQENYGLAAVCLGEAIWSFSQAPSFAQVKLLVPGALAAVILGLISGPMVTSGDPSSIGTGLWIATAVSVALGASYVAR
jgi:hypothetical protein